MVNLTSLFCKNLVLFSKQSKHSTVIISKLDPQVPRYDENRKFFGILYLHNICDPQVGGSSKRNLAMFKKLWGPDPPKNVVVVTTFWDEIQLDEGIQFETELKTKDRFFTGLAKGGSKFFRSGKFLPGKFPKCPEFLPPISIVSELVAFDPVYIKMQDLAEGKTVQENNDIIKTFSSPNSSAKMAIKEIKPAGLIAYVGHLNIERLIEVLL